MRERTSALPLVLPEPNRPRRFPGIHQIKEIDMAKITKTQSVTVSHTDTNGRTIPDGGKGERLVKGEARWTTGGRRIDGDKKTEGNK